MKKIIVLLCVYSTLFSTTIFAAQRNLGCKEEMLRLTSENSIGFSGKKILDIGSGSGALSALIANGSNITCGEAESIYGIDPNKFMVVLANKNHGCGCSIRFQHVPEIEEFASQQKYDMAVSFFYLDVAHNLEAIFTTIYNNLAQGAEFFGTLRAFEDSEPLSKQILNRLFSNEYGIISWTRSDNSKTKNNSDVRKMLEKIGFEILVFKQEDIKVMFKTCDDIKQIQQPIIVNHLYCRGKNQKTANIMFNTFIQSYIQEIGSRTSVDGNFIDSYKNTVLHLRKK